MAVGVLTLHPSSHDGSSTVDISGDFQLDGNTVTSGGGSYTLTDGARDALIRANAQIARGDHVQLN